MKIEVYGDGQDTASKREWIRRIVRAVLEGESWEGRGTLNIILVDDHRIRELNARFLGKDRPTDVMAFPLGEEEAGVWGEVYVSTERAAHQADDHGLPVEKELSLLIIHGVLHLLGYDDTGPSKRRMMEKKERHYIERLMPDDIEFG